MMNKGVSLRLVNVKEREELTKIDRCVLFLTWDDDYRTLPKAEQVCSLYLG